MMSEDARVRAGPADPAGPGNPTGPDEPTVRHRWWDETPPEPDAACPAGTVRAGDHGVDAGVDALLVSVHGPDAGSLYPLVRTTVSIGRRPECDIRLDDVTVSRRHAHLRRVGTRFTITDMGSLNGTYVNQERVESSVLANNDELQIGRFRLVFRVLR